MATGNFFAGTFTRRPRVAARVDDFGLTPISAGPVRTVAIIGAAAGGEPHMPQLFASPEDAQAVLRSGELLTALRRSFSPSTEFNGASLVYAVRVNPATGATLMLQATGVDVLLLTSKNWGLEENQIKVKIETGSTQGKKITLAQGSSTYVKDNLHQTAFSIRYTGAGTAATMTITGTTLTTVITGGPGTEALTVDLNVHNTIQKVVDYIAAAALGAYTTAVTGPNPSAASLNGLDFVTAQDIKTAVFTVTSILQAVVDWFNGGQQPLVKATRQTPLGGAAPTNIPYTFLTGGSEGTTTNGDWQACLEALQPREIAFVVPVTADPGVHAMTDVHCHFMSVDGKRPRRAFVGGPLGEYSTNLQTYLTRGANLNSDRTALAIQGIKAYDDQTGVETLYPPYIMAAAWAGLQSGLPEIGDSITQKAVRAIGVEWIPTVGELEIALAGGLLVVELVENKGFYRICRGLSTWLKNDAYHRCEISVGIALDEVVRRVVDSLDLFLGQKASSIILHRIASRTQSTLISLAEQGIIVGDAAHPPYRDITVKLQGDTARVSFACQPVLVINFINVTVYAETFSGTVTIETI